MGWLEVSWGGCVGGGMGVEGFIGWMVVGWVVGGLMGWMGGWWWSGLLEGSWGGWVCDGMCGGGVHGGVGGWRVHGWVSVCAQLTQEFGHDGWVGVGMMGGWA